MKIILDPSGLTWALGSAEMPKVLPLEEAAERFGVSVVTLRRAIRQGRLRKWKVWGDRRTFVAVEEVEALREPRPIEGEPDDE